MFIFWHIYVILFEALVAINLQNIILGLRKPILISVNN